MPRSILFVFTAALLAVSVGPFAQGASLEQTTTIGGASLAIDGVFAGNLRQWEGGEPWADIVGNGLSAGPLPNKHVSNIRYLPLVLELDFPPLAPAATWINDLCTGRPTAKNIRVTILDASGRPLGCTDYLGSALTEVRFPALDASSSATATITLVITPQRVLPGTEAITGSGGSRALSVNGFALRIGTSLTGAAVTKIDSFTVKAPIATNSSGNFREPTITQSPVTTSNLVLTVRDSQAAAWKAWRDSFLVEGHHLEGDEQGGTITLGGNGDSGAGVSLTFSHMGLVGLTRIPGTPVSTAYDKVEVYFEGVTLAGPQAPGNTTSAPVPTQPAAAQPAATDSSSTPATSTPAAESTSPAAAPADQGKKTTQAAVIDQARLPAASSTQAASNSTARAVDANPPASAAAAGGTDAGPRDPADFPRLGGTVRTQFSATAGKVQADESATYTTGASFDQVAAFYNSQPKSAGWEEVYRSENSHSASGRAMLIDWRKPQKTAQVRINLLPNGGTEIWLTVTTQKTGK